MSAYGDDLEDHGTNPSTQTHLSDLIDRRLSRRSVLVGSTATAVAFLAPALLGTGAAAAAPRPKDKRVPKGAEALLGYDAVPLGYSDEVVVPKGYTAVPFLPWGTPLVGADAPDFVPGQGTEETQSRQVGMHHDGMHYFPLDGSRRGLLVMNHEYTDEALLHRGRRGVARPTRTQITPEQVRTSQAAHGVSVAEVERGADGQWRLVPGSRKNRRIHANTPMRMSGPAAGSPLVRTSADPGGTRPIGTINNCAHGFTPWGTYLIAEENFNGYFRREAGAYEPATLEGLNRYGVNGDSYYWAEHDPRFRVSPAEPNEPNRFGWIVEFDPNDPTSVPVKRTALGRNKHEGAFVHVTKGQRVVVYMGDDQRDEFAYKFVGSDSWKSLLARGKDPLDEGTLYVAQFDDDGRGRWLPLVHGQGGLTPENGFADQAEVLVKTRQAATLLGATPMDRPEWTSVDPATGAVYLALTNNSSRTVADGPNPRVANRWGQVLRWYEDGDDHAATTFRWDLFVVAGQGRSSGDGSTIDDEDAFGSPDGLWVDPDSRVWIQTDGTQPFGANDQMLAANPFVVDAEGRPELKRFFTGVRGCEVTGVITTPDQRTMFVNIQHPGDGAPDVTWPAVDGLTVPRSATVVVTKDDGGVIGT